MAQINCPFCGSRDVLKIVYAQRGVKGCNESHITKNKEIFRYKRERSYIINALGNKVYVNRNNKYCNNCFKEYKSKRVLTINEVSSIKIIFKDINSKTKLLIDLYEKKIIVYYNYLESLIYIFEDDDIVKLYNAIKKLELKSLSKTIKIKNNNSFYWCFKLSYINGLSDAYDGIDYYFENIMLFLKVLKTILNIDKYISKYAII